MKTYDKTHHGKITTRNVSPDQNRHLNFIGQTMFNKENAFLFMSLQWLLMAEGQGNICSTRRRWRMEDGGGEKRRRSKSEAW